MASNILFKNGKSKYQIAISAEASSSEQTAAKELQAYIKQIGGVELPITNSLNSNGPKIFVGYNDRVSQLVGKQDITPDYEGFTYCNKGKHLIIYGGSKRGTMYGVFSFLEDQFGVRWYTPNCTKVPKLKKWNFVTLHHSEEPAIQYRYSNYFVTENVSQWSAHNKENMKWGPVDNLYGNIEAYWNAHTMGQLVTAKEFFKEHPEYFALRNGKRIDNGQLCLSNPNVLDICKKRLFEKMKSLPGYRIFSLSQNDNQSFCECPNCKAMEERYGGHSGLIIWFVNQVADEAQLLFPQKYIGTFAYQYSRKPPVGIRPKDNVVVRLCSIECCFAHPITAECPQNKAFVDDMKAWSKIAPHLFIWDYIVDYAQYIAPWPNFQVLGPNIQAFREHNVIGVFEEAQYQSGGAEFDEMKAWVANKLLWNPQQDVNVLVKDFIDGYYGNAAPKIMEYYLLCQSLVNPQTHFGIYIRENDPIYSDEFIQKGFSIINGAKQDAENDTIKERVERVSMQLLYLQSVRNRKKSIEDGTWAEFVRLARRYNAKPSEGQTLDSFISSFEANN
ncbi:DUF4838 domain-containing protein [Bacteroides faecalis]|uniref:Alpha glucuronidase N-terminal domain-containing protein n=1 Tax=Bacteroides faecalis TaxID=2447885 RepID=A0A401LW04_9BACE|nr:DUF4838 domain-containing protein [Bacteroides faecalis]GCB35692.1 hypothetical protein KGMB02408_26370 [Bacteroides faecalis]